jgi:hypothetical protein
VIAGIEVGVEDVEKGAGGSVGDEGMTSGPLIFDYLVFGPGRVSFERLLRPIKAAV